MGMLPWKRCRSASGQRLSPYYLNSIAMFDDFYGNEGIQEQLAQMIANDRIPQTILLAGPEGVGKATLARRFAARLIGHADLIEKDDLNREENATLIAE